MINLTIGFGEALTAIALIGGAIWGLLKLAFNQYDQKQETRHIASTAQHKAQNESLTAKFSALENKVNALDVLVLEVKKLEIEQVRRDAQYSEKFVTKAENDLNLAKQEKVWDKLFTLIEKINEKLDMKANKTSGDTSHKHEQ